MSKQVQKEWPIKIHKADGTVADQAVKTFTELQKSISSDYLQQVPALSTSDNQGKIYLVDEEILYRDNNMVAVNISEIAQTALKNHTIYGDIIEVAFKDMEAMPYSEND